MTKQERTASLIQKLRDFPYVLAPMAGITNASFRMLMREMGSSVVVSELISATGIEYESKKTKDLCEHFEEERPVGLQIFGENAEHLAKAAQWIERRGVDFVDINLGCPVPKVVSKGAGSAMLREPGKLYKMLKQVVESIEIPLTIKIRTGWDSNSTNALENVCAAAEAGVAWVAIHGRTRAQGYSGLSDWDFISKVKSKSPIAIIGNGDILTADQAMQRLDESGCDAVMIGRGALRNPFIFQQIAKKSDRLDLFRFDETTDDRPYWRLISRHVELLSKSQLGAFYVGILLRKFMVWYSAGMDGAAKFRKALYELDSNEANNAQVINLGRDFFDRPNVKKSASYLSEPFLQGGHG